MSTFSDLAIFWTFASGRILKPIIIALEAEANITSVSLTFPTPECIMSISTSLFSIFIFFIASCKASKDPCVSVFKIIFNLSIFPSFISKNKLSKESSDFSTTLLLLSSSLSLIIILASLSSGTIWK